MGLIDYGEKNIFMDETYFIKPKFKELVTL